jgi:hypothetical protein
MTDRDKHWSKDRELPHPFAATDGPVRPELEVGKQLTVNQADGAAVEEDDGA